MGLQGDVWVRYFSDREPLWFSERPVTKDCLSEALAMKGRQMESADTPHSLDLLEAQVWAQGPVLHVQGWLAPADAGSRNGLPAGVALFNLDQGGLTVFDAHAQYRPDVAEHFKHLKLDPKTLGLFAIVPFSDLPHGRYEVALHWQHDGLFKFKKTGRTVVWASSGLMID
jgi:hypothetical protein